MEKQSYKPQAKATSSVKSGQDNKEYARKTLGGFPKEKSISEINAVNSVKSYSESSLK